MKKIRQTKAGTSLLFKFDLKMRLSIVCLLIPLLGMQAKTSYAQKVVSLNYDEISISDLLDTLENKSDYRFVYRVKDVDLDRKLSVSANKEEVENLVTRIFKETDVNPQFFGDQIFLNKKLKSDNSIADDLVIDQQDPITITGTVKDGNGVPLPGVNITIEGTSKGTSTDFDGNYEIEAEEGQKLVFSSIGFEDQIIEVGNDDVVDVQMQEGSALDEVVVVGYGTQKRSDVTGSVSSISGEKLSKLPTANSEATLQGMAPGLSVNFGSGEAGSTPKLQVRGVTTWGSENDPLVIIDGVPGDMSFLNPEDIESVSVLKDASTASIYGARAAAGVILIETKRGGKGKPRIQFSSYWGVDDVPKRLKVANSSEFIKIRKMALTSAGISENRWPKYISEYERDPTQFADTDWQDEYYRRGTIQKYNLSYSSGNEFGNLALSTFYSNTDAVQISTGEKKYGFRINSDITRGKFKVGESISYSARKAELESGTGLPSIYQVTNMEPLAFVHDETNAGGYGGAIKGMGMSDAANMVGFNNLLENTSDKDYLSASGYVQFEPSENLFLKFQAGRSITSISNTLFIPTYEIGATKVNNRASLTENRSKNVHDVIEFTANWDKNFNDVNSIHALFGLSQEEERFELFQAAGKKFDNNDLRVLGQAQEDFSIDGEKTRSGLRSMFGRLNYDYDMRYLVTASFRYDGSSRFSNGNNWGFFPSASLGWNIANESFWERMKETFSGFKLRLSYGGLGNQSIGLYEYIPKLNSNTNTLNYPFGGRDINLGYAITDLPSRDIKWETTIYKNIGIDLALWKNKLEFTAEAYIKDTKDMLSTKNISASTGFGPLIVNDGRLRTTGFEIQTIYHDNMKNGLKYDIDLNLSHYKSILKSMADPDYLDEDGPSRTYVGGEIGELWVLKTDGIFQDEEEVRKWNDKHGSQDENGVWQGLQPSAKPGDIRFIDLNEDGLLDSNDKIKVGTGTPKVSLALNINIEFKSFDLMANFYGHFGAKRYNHSKFRLERMDNVYNYGRAALNSWKPDNTETDIPRAVQGDPNENSRISDRFIEKGDYLRLNNLQIGYNFSNELLGKYDINNLRIYVGGSRLFTITKYSGYDPSTGNKVGSMGYDYAAAPLSRSYMLGIKLSF